MKFSIVMASYNQVNFIKEAIESVLNQTYQNFELLIIDGNSNDGTIEIINQYKNNDKIKILIEKDEGLYHARNKGLLLANGDIISFLNTDDYYEKTALEDIKNAFEMNDNIDVFYGINYAVDKSGKFIRAYGNFEFDKNRMISKYLAIPDQTTFLRANKLPVIGLFDSTFSIVADWDFWQRGMCLNLKFKHLNKHIANYRHYEETLTFSPKFVEKRFFEVKRLYRKYNNICFSPFIIKIYYWHYIKRPLKNIKLIEKFYRKFKS